MIKKIKATISEKIILIFLILLGTFTLASFIIIKNQCLLIKNYNPKNIEFKNPQNIAILNAPCGNVIIELYPGISPKSVHRFKRLIKSGVYTDVAFHRVIENKLVQAGDLRFGKKDNLKHSLCKRLTGPELIIFDLVRTDLQYICYGTMESFLNGTYDFGKYQSVTVKWLRKPKMLIMTNKHLNYWTMSADRWGVYELNEGTKEPKLHLCDLNDEKYVKFTVEPEAKLDCYK